MQLQKIAITLGCCCLIAGFPSVAGAQTVTGSFADLAGKLKPGKTVYVTDGAGRKVKGKMTDLSVSSLQVLIDGNEETFVEGGVRQIAERRRYTGDFAATGFAAGALLGVVFGAVVGPPCSCTGKAMLIGAGLFGGAGAGAGAAIGAVSTFERVIYRSPNPRPAATVGLSPFVSKHGTGLSASLRF